VAANTASYRYVLAGSLEVVLESAGVGVMIPVSLTNCPGVGRDHGCGDLAPHQCHQGRAAPSDPSVARLR
jgi:hypothetical protein